MAPNNFLAEQPAADSYQAQMSALRIRLAGRPYCKEVQKLVTGLTKATIHGAVNGRNENELVLSALKIVVHKLDKEHDNAKKHLEAVALEVGACM